MCVSGLPSPGPRIIDVWYLVVLPHFRLDTAFGPSVSFRKKSAQTEHPKTSGGRSLWSRGSIRDGVQPDTTLPCWVPLFNSLPKSTLHLLVSDYWDTRVLGFLTTWSHSAFSRSHPKCRCPDPSQCSTGQKDSR